MTSKLDILDAAKKVVAARGERYGEANDHFSRTVGMLNVMLADKLKIPLVPADWPIVMICDKLAREANEHHDDNPIDIAGYAACLGEIAARRRHVCSVTLEEWAIVNDRCVGAYGIHTNTGQPFIWQSADAVDVVSAEGLAAMSAYFQFIVRASNFYLAKSGGAANG